MSDKLDKRKGEMCYNCKHFTIRETKNRTMFICNDDRFRLVGAGWCKSYEAMESGSSEKPNNCEKGGEE